MVDKSFIEKIVELAPANLHGVGGRQLSDKKLHEIPPPSPSAMRLHTLTGLEDYILSEFDGESIFFVHIVAPGQVLVVSQLEKVYRTREMYLSASIVHDGFPFESFMEPAKFVISMQAMFVQTDQAAKILKLVGNMVTTSEARTLDDGVSQSIEAKVGLAKREMQVVPNPVTLAPYRTFLEVEQPASDFVLRISAADHSCALFEADGGAWKNEAILNIKARLESTLADLIASKSVVVLG